MAIGSQSDDDDSSAKTEVSDGNEENFKLSKLKEKGTKGTEQSVDDESRGDIIWHVPQHCCCCDTIQYIFVY